MKSLRSGGMEMEAQWFYFCSIFEPIKLNQARGRSTRRYEATGRFVGRLFRLVFFDSGTRFSIVRWRTANVVGRILGKSLDLIVLRFDWMIHGVVVRDGNFCAGVNFC
jgi:hypothetical protein